MGSSCWSTGVVEEDAQRRVHEADETKNFLDAERKHADEDLKTKESALAGFLAAHPVYAHEAVGTAASAGGANPRAGAHTRRAGVVLGRGRAAGAASGADRGGAGSGRRARRRHRAGRRSGRWIAARERARAELQPAQRALTEKQAMYTNEHPDVKAAIRHVAMAEAAFHRAEAAVEADRAGQRQGAPATPAAADEGQDTARTAALSTRWPPSARRSPVGQEPRGRGRGSRCTTEGGAPRRSPPTSSGRA